MAHRPHWGGGGMGIGLRGLASASNAQEVKFAVLGAELRRRLKKKSERQISLSRKQDSVCTLSELGARALTPQVGLLKLLCLPPRRGWTGRRTLPLRGRPEGAGGSPPAAELRGLGSEGTKLVQRKIWNRGHKVWRLAREWDPRGKEPSGGLWNTAPERLYLQVPNSRPQMTRGSLAGRSARSVPPRPLDASCSTRLPSHAPGLGPCHSPPYPSYPEPAKPSRVLEGRRFVAGVRTCLPCPAWLLTRRPTAESCSPSASHGSCSWPTPAWASPRPPGPLLCFLSFHACFKNCLLVGASGCTVSPGLLRGRARVLGAEPDQGV